MRLLSLVTLSLFACGEPSLAPQPVPAPGTAAPSPAETPADPHAGIEGMKGMDNPHAKAGAAPGADPDAVVRYGKVVEILPGGDRYTYARMDACGQEAWVAGPAIEVEVGTTLQMKGGATMANFESTTLGRTFDRLMMVNGWEVSDTPLDCAAMAPPVAAPAGKTIGTAKEIKAGAGYTFVLMDTCGTESWFAGPETPVQVGDIVAFDKVMPMENFTAKSIGQTFEKIGFVQQFQKASALPACK